MIVAAELIFIPTAGQKEEDEEDPDNEAGLASKKSNHGFESSESIKREDSEKKGRHPEEVTALF